VGRAEIRIKGAESASWGLAKTGEYLVLEKAEKVPDGMQLTPLVMNFF
jgi:hypothetical protein